MTQTHNSPENSKRGRQLVGSLSQVAENYLLCILQIEEQGVTGITASQLADQLKRLPVSEGLGTSLPSVGGMLSRMAKEGLVDSSPRKTVTLTQKGRIHAESILRRHRLAECMVVDIFKLDLHQAHVEAHKLEHAISTELAEKINEKLDHPTTCPFGHPIPGSTYKPAKGASRLSSIPQNEFRVIDRVPEDDQKLLRYLVENEIIPGKKILIQEVAPYRGIVTISQGECEVVVSSEVADRIWVRPQ